MAITGHVFRSEVSHDGSSSLLAKFSRMKYLLLATSKLQQLASPPGEAQINAKTTSDLLIIQTKHMGHRAEGNRKCCTRHDTPTYGGLYSTAWKGTVGM